MTRHALSLSLLMTLLSANPATEVWTSLDELITVAVPDAAHFVTVEELPPEFAALWISHDESTKLAVIRIELPKNTGGLIQSSVEEGLAKEVGGKVVRLPTRTVSGHDVWNMKATGPAGEITQAFARHGDVVYKMMAMTPQSDGANDAVKQFMESLSFKQTAVPNLNQAQAGDAKRGNLNDLSRMIGGFGGIVLIGLIIYLSTQRKKTPN